MTAVRVGAQAQDSCPTCGSSGKVERRYIPVEGHPLFAGRAIAACVHCGLRYCDPMPSEDENLSYYLHGDYDSGARDAPRQAGAWQLASLRSRAHVDLVTKCLGNTPKSWLDIGAGYGLLLDEARKRGVSRTAGTEPTPVRMDDLRARGHEAWADVSDVPNQWEVVSISHVLEHVVDPTSFLDGVSNLMTDRGILLCEVPNVPLHKPDPDEPHVLFFVATSLRHTIERAGMRILFLDEAGRRTGKGWDRLTRYSTMAKKTGRVPKWMSRFDAVHRYGRRQGRIYLRCVATRR